MLIAAVVLLVLVLGLKTWVTSGIGRGVLESRLSSALGRPARLDGDFSLELLPLPGASGSQLRIFSQDGRWLVLDAGSYLAQLALLPLLKGEVEVVALRVENAALDLARLAGEQTGFQKSDAVFANIPGILSFDLSGVNLHFDGMGSDPYLHIAELSVDGFEVDGQADFEAEVSLNSGNEQQAVIDALGMLTLDSDGVVRVVFSQLDLESSGWQIEGLKGDVTAELDRAVLAVGLRWDDGQQQVGINTAINWNPGFPETQPGYAIEKLELRLGNEILEGNGCLLGEGPPQLNLELQAPSLQLNNAIQLFEKWGLPSASFEGSGVVNTEMSFAGEMDDSLPVDLAVRLRIIEASYNESVARGVRLTVGPAPECPDIL